MKVYGPPGKNVVTVYPTGGKSVTVPGSGVVETFESGESGPAGNGLLMETGDFLLLETGDYILMEA